MKAITMHQPWASLIAIGEKKFETRSWETKHRGPIAIHAAKKIDHDAVELLATKYPEIWRKISPLPTGCVVAIADLSDCHNIHIDHTGDAVLLKGHSPVFWVGSGSAEYEFGWYSLGRVAWELTKVRAIDPVPVKGQQGLWNWNHEEM